MITLVVGGVLLLAGEAVLTWVAWDWWTSCDQDCHAVDSPS